MPTKRRTAASLSPRSQRLANSPIPTTPSKKAKSPARPASGKCMTPSSSAPSSVDLDGAQIAGVPPSTEKRGRQPADDPSHDGVEGASAIGADDTSSNALAFTSSNAHRGKAAYAAVASVSATRARRSHGQG